ncbi:hypothetical protein P879_08512 [Paragonimus westermani]|uniref:Uncharacterized protein n=1 Tax=Paragonimus westermani TaxID=34504 RepID=A0A8T0DCA3_9TREM|nr:hypothetical protein P879_08512 [Paragonimus westermani]
MQRWIKFRDTNVFDVLIEAVIQGCRSERCIDAQRTNLRETIPQPIQHNKPVSRKQILMLSLSLQRTKLPYTCPST